MFGLYAKISEYIWGTEGSEDTKPSVSKDRSHNKVTNGKADNSLNSCPPLKPRLKKDLFGKVTRLYDGAGVIEEDVYFTFDTLIGGARPEIGTEVHVEAIREKEATGWKAVRVQVISEWNLDDIKNSSSAETFIGTITNIEHDSGVVDDDVTFKMSCVRFGYVPFQGDWVKLDLDRTSDGTAEVRGVMPLREKNLTGVVTYVSPAFGYIDGEVFFSCGVCARGYRPRQGDVVKATAIESKQGKAVWRAIKVEPKKTHSAVLSPSPHTQMFMGGKMAELMRNKEGLTITDQLNFGDVLVGESKSLIIWISNQGENGHIFQSCTSIRDDPQFSVQLAKTTSAQLSTDKQPQKNKALSLEERLAQGSLLAPGMEIPPKQAKQLSVVFTARSEVSIVQRHMKQYNVQYWVLKKCDQMPEVLLELPHGRHSLPNDKGKPNWFENFQTKEEYYGILGRVNHLLVFSFGGFEIGRYVTARVQDSHQALLGPSAPYQQSYNRTKQARRKVADSMTGEECIIPGEKPIRKRKLFLPVKLAQYDIPRDIRRCILDGRDLGAIIPALREPLTLKNYAAWFSSLLYCEELQMEIDMREFDMEGVNMNVCGEFLSLQVPGLSEGRPSLLLGDKIVASLTGSSSSDSPKYEGYIHEVRKDEILLKFNEEFHNRFAMQECDVMFYFNRTTLRRCHRAVEFASSLGERVLFPRTLSPKLPVMNLTMSDSSKTKQKDHDQSGAPSCKSKDKSSTTEAVEDFLYNSCLNERQRAAVCRIVSGQCRPTPYLLFGPPGTGKTITVVEAILQIFHRIPSSRVLACTPSNSAADLIAERLHMSGFIQEGDMVRLNAIQRAQDIPEAITPYCTDTDQLDTVAHYRVIISTCSTAGQLYSLGLRAGHITHVFVDEAGQATEPECLVAVGLAAGDDGQVILAGDPFQLGPVLQSRVASSYGLNISLLERLISRPLYYRNEEKFSDHGCYDPLLVTKLVDSYRSHPAVLKLPSAVFYHDELIPCADVRMRESLCQWEKLPNKGFPVIFHGLKGEDLREGNSPSWFNPVEAVQVTKYLQSLRSSDQFSLKLNDIGVITPYRKQVEKLRLFLGRFGLEEVKVGSVEEFQGQERLAVIISTVRSNDSLVGVDVRHSVGFLSNPKRFNVAITRAQALLIIVGNPHVLCQDPYWCCLLQYCVMNDSYVGCDLPSLDQHFLKEEFQAASALLSKALRSKDKLQENKDEAACPESNDSTISRNITDTLPQKPGADTRNSDLQADVCQAIAKDTDYTAPDDTLVYIPSQSNSEKQSYPSWTAMQKQKQDSVLSSDKQCSSNFKHEAFGFNGGHVRKGQKGMNLVQEEQNSESDDELEQFVLQPKTIPKK